MQNQSDVQDSIDSLIDVLNTQALAEDQIEDTCEHEHTSHFRRHCRTHFQKHCKLTDCHSFFSVDPFYHNTTSACDIVFEASIPESSYRFPCCGIIFSVDINLSPSLCAYIGLVIFFVMFSVAVLHEAVDVRDWRGHSSLPP